jgi:hypothetical protein
MWAAVRGAEFVLRAEGPIVTLAASVSAGALAYALALLVGDALGLWRGYVHDAFKFFKDSISRPVGPD